jgi:alpha-beta hydrolase superfamily lysophospholipase
MFRTWGDLRCMDPAIDPSDRPTPGCYRGHPAQANKTPGIGRANSLRTWLSMWSLETSKCQGEPHLSKFDLPSLVVQSTADMGVFPSDARSIFAAIASRDKTLQLVPGAHYFEDSEANRRNVADLMIDWLRSRL